MAMIDDDGDVELCYDASGKVDRSQWHETLQIISRPYAHRLANALDEAHALAQRRLRLINSQADAMNLCAGPIGELRAERDALRHELDALKATHSSPDTGQRQRVATE